MGVGDKQPDIQGRSVLPSEGQPTRTDTGGRSTATHGSSASVARRPRRLHSNKLPRWLLLLQGLNHGSVQPMH